MHNYLVNASIQLLPIVQNPHPYQWVDEAISIIQQSGIKHQVGAFATVVEGPYEAVMAVVHAINEHLAERRCAEWITSLQIQIRCDGDMTADEKTAKYNE